MSSLKFTVGQWKLEWKSSPRGANGTAHVMVGDSSSAIEVRWLRDGDGIWLEMPDGLHGFDLRRELNDDGSPQYHLVKRSTGEFWSGVSLVKPGMDAVQGAAGAKKKGVRVRAQMPGKIVRILVASGAKVEKDQPLLVMEAMKMENEIRAPMAGSVMQLKVTEGQAVETGADLVMIE